jgi:hypothetical protein
VIGCDEYSWNNETRIVKTVDTLYFEKLPMKGIEAFEEVPLGNKTDKSFIVKRPSQTRGPISLHDDKGKFFNFPILSNLVVIQCLQKWWIDLILSI